MSSSTLTEETAPEEGESQNTRESIQPKSCAEESDNGNLGRESFGMISARTQLKVVSFATAPQAKQT